MDDTRGTSAAERIAHLARPLRAGVFVLERIAIASAIAGSFAGIAIAAHTATKTLALRPVKTHPWTAPGVAVVIAALLLGTLGWCVARAIRLFVADTAARYSVDVDQPTANRLPEFAQRPGRRR